jgi:hypothetical protein
MREAEENTARFPDLNIDDFERICEFAYRGEYQVPKPEGPSEALADDGSSNEPEQAESSPDIKDSSDGEWDLAKHFVAKPYLKSSTPHASITTLFNPQYHWDAQDDYTPVLVGHARLYTFGDKYLIPSLKDLALKKIHKTLAGYSISLASREAFMELARYAYDTNYTPDRHRGTMNPLRALVVEFIVLNITQFKYFPGHRELLEEEGEYSTDVVDTITKWLL